MTNFFAELPEADQAKIAKLAWRYLRLPTIPDAATALDLLAWHQLEVEVMEAHAAWLENAKTKVESSGDEWNRENFLRHTRLWEVE